MRVGEVGNPRLNGQLHYPSPTDIDRSLNEVAVDKIRDYRGDYNNRPSHDISFMSGVCITYDHLHYELVRFFFVHQNPTVFFVASGVQVV